MYFRRNIWNMYIFLFGAADAVIYIKHFEIVGPRHLWMLLLMSVIAALFELRLIELPFVRGGVVTLVSSLLLATAISYGTFSVFTVLFFSLPIMLLAHRLQNWSDLLFNTAQYAFTTFIGLLMFQRFGGHIGVMDISEPLPVIVFVVTFFVINNLVVRVGYLVRGDWSFADTLQNLYDPQYLVLYFVVMSFGVIMTYFLLTSGIRGVVFSSVVFWFIGFIYRRYFEVLTWALRDDLTGLFNRRYFSKSLRKYAGSTRTVSLLLLDLDHFKQVNDQFGHAQGDRLLVEVSQLLMFVAGPDAIACRYGGEEFAVLLPDVNTEQAVERAERMRLAVAARDFEACKSQPGYCVTVSIGIATYPTMISDTESMIEYADQALYDAKAKNRNQVCVFQPASTPLS